MTWFKVDDGFALHPKAIAAGNAALGLWVRAGSWCGAHLTDGALPKHMVGTLGAQARDARKLVAVGLWCETERGYQFKDWEQYQPSKAQVDADRAAARERQRRHREQQRHGVTDGVTSHVTNGVTNASPSRPVPSSSGSVVSHSPAVPSERTSDDRPDLDKIAAELGQDRRWAQRVTADVLGRTTRPPGDPTAYVLAAIRSEPSRYQPTGGPPPVHRLCNHGRDRLTCPDCEDQP